MKERNGLRTTLEKTGGHAIENYYSIVSITKLDIHRIMGTSEDSMSFSIGQFKHFIKFYLGSLISCLTLYGRFIAWVS